MLGAWGRGRHTGPMRLRFLLILTIALVSTSALAQKKAAPSGAEFMRLCESANPEGQRACSELVLGVIDVDNMIGQKRPDMRKACVVRRLSLPEARRVFLNWAKTHDEIYQMDFLTAAMAAVTSTYPCPK